MTEQVEASDGDGERLLRATEVAARLDVSVRTVDRLVKQGKFPPPLEAVGTRRWRLTDVIEAMHAMRTRAAPVAVPRGPPIGRIVRPPAAKVRAGPKAGHRHA